MLPIKWPVAKESAWEPLIYELTASHSIPLNWKLKMFCVCRTKYGTQKSLLISWAPWLFRSSDCYSLASHRGGPGSKPGHVTCDVCMTKPHCGRFCPSTSASPAKHSTDCSTLIIIRGWYNRPNSGLSSISTSPPPQKKRRGGGEENWTPCTRATNLCFLIENIRYLKDYIVDCAWQISHLVL
jgi:hypothetical protein